MTQTLPPTAPPTTLVTRLVRCMGVSVITTIVSVTMLAATTVGLGLAAWIANVLATAVATVPSYHLNRRWTWGKRDSSDLWREIMPFWVLSFAGLVLSTLAVALTDSWLHGAHLGQPLHTFVILAAHLSGFGILWVAQFVLLERVLFVGRGGFGGRGSPLESPREHDGVRAGVKSHAAPRGVAVEAEKMHPPPTVTAVKGLPQFPPFPEYGLAQIEWPARSAADGG